VTPAEVALPCEDFTLEAVVEGAGPRAVIVCHPHPAFGGTLDTPLVAAFAAALAAAGRRVLRFNFRGIGASGGRPTGGTVEHRDVAAAHAWLVAEGARDVALVGYSFGALMAARALAEGLPATAFAAVGLPSTIVADHADRVAYMRAAMAATPSLLLTGTDDPFSRLPDLRAFAEGTPARVVALEGQGHFFAGPALADVIARTLAFLDAPA